MNVERAPKGFSLTFGRTSLLACNFNPTIKFDNPSSSPTCRVNDVFSLMLELECEELEEEVGTTASLADPVTTAASLSVSSEVGPLKADQNDEASFDVMWFVAAPAK